MTHLQEDGSGGGGAERGEGGGGGRGEARNKKGLGVGRTAFLLVAQLAGAGFLALPKALANSGWMGLVMMVVSCLGVEFSATRLGKSWVVLEERWPQVYGQGTRQPYVDMAERALGRIGRTLTLACCILGLLGGTTVFLLVTAGFLNSLVPEFSTCEWVLISAAVVLPFTWLGTPKDFWQASVVAVVATAVTCIVIFVEVLLEADQHENPVYKSPTFSSFFLGFGTILFSFAGALVFPTFQNDMKNRSQFWKSIVIGFLAILTLYVPMTTAGYAVQGTDMGTNILLTLDTDKGVVKAAIVMEILNLLGTFIVSFNPVAQACEELLKMENNKFGWKRIALRSALVLVEVVISLAVPSFDKILNLLGGCITSTTSLVLPPLIYTRLVDMRMEQGWTYREIPLWERTLLWEMVVVGAVGGVSATVNAVMDILNQDTFSQSCFANFS